MKGHLTSLLDQARHRQEIELETIHEKSVDGEGNTRMKVFTQNVTTDESHDNVRGSGDTNRRVTRRRGDEKLSITGHVTGCTSVEDEQNVSVLGLEIESSERKSIAN
jgi:hypothetical protein